MCGYDFREGQGKKKQGFEREICLCYGGAARQRRTTHIDKARLDLGIGKASVDLLVELLGALGAQTPNQLLAS
jgi:hypothetical protein